VYGAIFGASFAFPHARPANNSSSFGFRVDAQIQRFQRDAALIKAAWAA
jgi:hypothetical protein